VSIAIGGLATYLKPIIGIPILVILLGLGIYLICKAYKREGKIPILIASNIIEVQTTQKFAKSLDLMTARWDFLANGASKHKLSDYLKYFQGKLNFEDYKREHGEVEAIIEELYSCSTNPLLEELKENDSQFQKLQRIYVTLHAQVADPKSIGIADLTTDLAKEGYRNWLRALAREENTSPRTEYAKTILSKYQQLIQDQKRSLLKRIQEFREGK